MSENWSVRDFAIRPSMAGEVLKRLHLQPLERVQFLEDYTRFVELVRPTDSKLDELYHGGMPQAVMDCALDRRLYEEYPSKSDASLYLNGLYATILRLVHYAIGCGRGSRTRASAVRAPWSKRLLNSFPQLWTLCLEHSSLIVCDPWDESENAGGGANMRTRVADLLCAELSLSIAETGNIPGILRSDGPHVATLCWLSETRGKWKTHIDPVFTSYHQVVNPNDFRTFVGRAFARKTITPEALIKRCNADLLSETTIDGALSSLVDHFVFFTMHPTMKPRATETEALALNFLRAAQRQVCCGRDDLEWAMLKTMFMVIGELMKNLPRADLFGTSHEFSHNVIVLLARSVVPGAMESDREELRSLKPIMRLFTGGAAALRTGHVDWIDFRGSVHRVWHRAHEDLQALRPAIAPHRSVVMELWLDLGRKCGVDVEAPYEPSPDISDGSGAWSKDRGCAWKECLCFGERPYHKLRKCKRCNNILYCSTKCQKSDWDKGGHKRVCRPPSS